MKLTEKTRQVGDITLNYAEGDGTGPPMILLHGSTGMWQLMKMNFIPTYGNLWHQYAIDLRGHGRSGHAANDDDYLIADFVEDVIAFIKSEIRDPAVIAGHSLGALTAIGVGAAIGEDVRALVLIDPPLAARELPPDALPEPFSWFSWVYETISSNPSYDQVVEACRAIEPELNEQELREMAYQVHNLSPGMVKAILDDRTVKSFDVGAAFEEISCPVLLMYGEFGHSAAMRDVDASFASEHTSDLTVVKMPYDDHVFHETHWDETHPHITAFLERV